MNNRRKQKRREEDYAVQEERMIWAFYSEKQRRVRGEITYKRLDGSCVTVTEVRGERGKSNWEDGKCIGLVRHWNAGGFVNRSSFGMFGISIGWS